MKLDPTSSERLKLLRFPLIVGVVFIHGACHTGLSPVNTEAVHISYPSLFIMDLISQGIARIAVPLFFIMSGYFFFLGFEWSLDQYKAKLRTRTNSLLIPFLFWNVLTLLLIALAQSFPAASSYLSGKHGTIDSLGIYDYLNCIFGITRDPISYQFWFIRDLMILILLAPLFVLILKKIPVIFISFLLVIWLLGLRWFDIPSITAIFFFSFGAFWAISKRDLFCLDRYGKVFLLAYGIILIVDIATKDGEFHDYIHRVGILLGIVAAFYATKLALGSKKIAGFLLWASSCSFFVFAMHEPALTITKRMTYRFVAPDSDATALLLYFLLPILVIAAAMLCYHGLKALVPKFLSIISGGR